MGFDYDLDRAPVMLEQPRAQLTFFATVMVAGTLLWATFERHVTSRSESAGYISGTVFFTLISIGAVAAAFRPSRLNIAAEGLTFRGTFASFTWQWSELSKISVISLRGMSGVRFDFAKPLTFGQRLARACGIPGYGGLPTGWPLGATELSKLLNDAKTRWG
ncbi:MAG: hypothetical protein JWP28_940 [Phenylobacterium sp.]|jgi:hypothetical protein|uniref:hypothetical protein n=1 Tax=Phenylobacterium sp. TaxID=1871053 RepID=UPI002612090E|nr:hypothetical protein [Phenylobacterium sp.]MDB5496909.1 hypothetical protein [Phenylobacterium sp.]